MRISGGRLVGGNALFNLDEFNLKFFARNDFQWESALWTNERHWFCRLRSNIAHHTMQDHGNNFYLQACVFSKCALLSYFEGKFQSLPRDRGEFTKTQLDDPDGRRIDLAGLFFGDFKDALDNGELMHRPRPSANWCFPRR